RGFQGARGYWGTSRLRTTLWSGATSKPERKKCSPVYLLITPASPVVMSSMKYGGGGGRGAVRGLSSACSTCFRWRTTASPVSCVGGGSNEITVFTSPMCLKVKSESS